MNDKLKTFFKKLNTVLFDMAEGKKWSDSELKISQREVGGKVELVDADGKLAPAQDGDYEMEDGFKFTVKDGQITAIEGEKAPEDEKPEEAPVEAAEEAPTEDPQPAEADELKARVDALEQVVAGLVQAVEELKAQKSEEPVAATKEDIAEFSKVVNALENKIIQVAKIPVEFSKTNQNNLVIDDKTSKELEMQKLYAQYSK